MTNNYPAGAAIQAIRAAIDQDMRDAYDSDEGMCGLTKADLPRLVSANPFTNLLSAIAELDSVDLFMATRPSEPLDLRLLPDELPAPAKPRLRRKPADHAARRAAALARTDGREDPASWSGVAERATAELHRDAPAESDAAELPYTYRLDSPSERG